MNSKKLTPSQQLFKQAVDEFNDLFGDNAAQKANNSALFAAYLQTLTATEITARLDKIIRQLRTG